MLKVKTADRRTWQPNDTWYVVEMTWMIQWLRYLFHSSSNASTSAADSAADSTSSSAPTSLTKSTAPGPVTNELLFLDDGVTPKQGITLKEDYRIVCAEVWELLVSYYGSRLSVAVTKKEHRTTPDEWNIQHILPKCTSEPAPSSLRIELVPHIHTIKCNRRVSVCDTPGKFRERELVRVSGTTGVEPGRIVWWRRRRRLGEHHSDEARDDDASNVLDEAWERIHQSSGQTQYSIRMEEHEHWVRAQYVHRDGEGDGRLILSNVVGPCEESGPMIHEISIVGEAVVGKVLVANVDYWGGTQGTSTYQWTRVKDGVRKKTDLQSVDPTIHGTYDPGTKNILEDPRCHVISEEDVGAKFKVSCTPKNMDGVAGEPKTSRPTKSVC